MKKLFLLLVSGFILQAGLVCAQGYNIKVTVPKMPNKKLILANYFEGKVYAVDTAQLNATGNGVFKKTDKKLARGMYLLLFSPSNYFDMIIGDNQNFSIQTDTLNVLENIRFEGSPENQAFLDFQKFMMSQNRKTKQISDALEKDPNKTSPEVRKKYSDQFNAADREVRSYIAGISKQFPGSALATFANFTLSPNVPDFAKEVPEGTDRKSVV